MPLFWRLFLGNSVALGLAFLVVVFGPVTVSFPTRGSEFVVLLLGLAALLLVNAAILGSALASLGELRDAMSDADAHVSLSSGAPPEVTQVALAYNGLLDRFERETTAIARASLQAQEDERGRIARDLHDEVGQNLTFLLLRLKGAAKDAPASVAADLEVVAEAARATLQEVRMLSRQLRPGVLGDLGLKPALAALLDDARELGLKAELDFPGWLTADAERDLVVYRVVQEALTNVVKHAQATSVTVGVHRRDDKLVVTIADDGTGASGPDGTGTASMRERARLIGGTFRRDAVAGAGTEVTIEVPFTVADTQAGGPPTRPIPTISLFPPVTSLNAPLDTGP